MFLKIDVLHSVRPRRTKMVCVVKCDNCQSIFGITHNVKRYENRLHHFCSKFCVDSSQKNGVLKIKKTKHFMNTYSVTNPGAILEVKEKKKKTCLKRYGVEHVLQVKSIKEKIKQTNVRRYGVEYQLQRQEIQAKSHSISSNLKRHETMKSQKLYRCSKAEKSLFELLQKMFKEKIQTNVRPNHKKRWTIDFYIKSINTYIQLDGVYWHGLDRSLEKIKEFKNPRDRKIYQKWLTDREVDEWFKSQNLKLLRFTDKDDALSMMNKLREIL